MKKKTTFELIVAYPAEMYFNGFDATIERAIGRRAHSSGMGCGERDLQFSFVRKAEAHNAGSKVRRLGLKIRATVWEGSA